MKISKVVERLPEFTPAFLDIAGLRAEEVVKLTAQDAQGVNLDDIQQLGVLSEVQQAIGHSLMEHRLEYFLDGLHVSLGALVRVTESIDGLGWSSSRKAGAAVLHLASDALEYSTSLKFQRSAQKLSSISSIGVKNVSTRNEIESAAYVDAHAASYVTLSPFMARAQRKYMTPRPKAFNDELL